MEVNLPSGQQLTEEMPGVYGAGEQVFVVTGGQHGGAIISYNDSKPFGIDISEVSVVTTKGYTGEFAKWGKNNFLPQEREALIMDNNIVPQLLEAKLDILLGAGIMLAKERFEDGKRIVEECEMPNQMRDWLEENEAETGLELAAKDYLINAQYFPEYLRKGGGDIASIEIIPAKYIRAEKMAKAKDYHRRRINNWLVAANWGTRLQDEVKAVANYNPKAKFQGKYIRRFGSRLFSNAYYYSPAYWGSRLWLKLSNLIPLFHLSNLNNGYTIRFHVKIPEDFFWRMVSQKHVSIMSDTEKKETSAKAKAKEREFKRKLNDVLKGAENAGRAIFTTYDVTKALGKEYAGIMIEPINFDMKDERLLKLFDASNNANISAQGMLPSISGVQTQGKLSSGSDIRNALAYYIAARSRRARREIYGAYNHVGKVNGWFTDEYANCFLTSRDIILTTTDKNPTGIEEHPTSNIQHPTS